MEYRDNLKFATPTRHFQHANMIKLCVSSSSVKEELIDQHWSENSENFPHSSDESLVQSPDNDGRNMEGKRGRPRADAISSLIMEGAQSPSSIKCNICARVFPRDKSLQAHLRTHTGERPYLCDFPGCLKAFAQSGQLKTHQRLHTGEKPFICSANGCTSRFTHANRHCNEHPSVNLRRSPDIHFSPQIPLSECSQDVLQWFERYKNNREDRTPAKTSNNSNSKRELEGTPCTPQNPMSMTDLITPPIKRTKSRRGLGPLMDQAQISNADLKDVTHDLQTYVYSEDSKYVSHFNTENSKNYVDENFYEEFYGHRLIHSSPMPNRVLRNSENLQTPVKNQCRIMGLEGIKPLNEAEDFSYTSSPSTSVVYSSSGLNLSCSEVDYEPPEKLLVGDITPIKRPFKSQFAKFDAVTDDIHDSNACESLSEVVLSVPQFQEKNFTRYHSTIKTSPGFLRSPLPKTPSDSFKMQPKKRWLHEARMRENLNDNFRDIDKEGNKTLMGAIALVQLAKPPEESMQPLNLTVAK